MFTITKEFAFEAMHYLPAMPDGHKCKRPHGHSYRVRVTLAARALDQYGFVRDYGDLAPIKEYIDGTLDHRNLLEIFPGEGNQTSAERLARALFERFAEQFPELVAVTVCETAKTSATYGVQGHLMGGA
jgi:6-pyruvoyltetrahydropterin/6-carboxytetrahydropterin synthase